MTEYMFFGAVFPCPFFVWVPILSFPISTLSWPIFILLYPSHIPHSILASARNLLWQHNMCLHSHRILKRHKYFCASIYMLVTKLIVQNLKLSDCFFLLISIAKCSLSYIWILLTFSSLHMSLMDFSLILSSFLSSWYSFTRILFVSYVLEMTSNSSCKVWQYIA